MSASIITELAGLINQGGNRERIETLEGLIIESIDEFAKENYFYELPTEEILEIIGKSSIEDTELLCLIVSKMSEVKGKDSALLINEINPEKHNV